MTGRGSGRRWALTGLTAIALVTSVRSATTNGIAVMVPAYFGPDSRDWQRLADAAARGPLIAIANVFNGLGTVVQKAYEKSIRAGRVGQSFPQPLAHVTRTPPFFSAKADTLARSTLRVTQSSVCSSGL